MIDQHHMISRYLKDVNKWEKQLRKDYGTHAVTLVVTKLDQSSGWWTGYAEVQQ